jgi:hypothetical protein
MSSRHKLIRCSPWSSSPGRRSTDAGMRGGEEVGGVGLRLGFLAVYKQMSSALFVRSSFSVVF